MTHPQNDIMIRSITGAEELGLFCALDYLFNDELADDLVSQTSLMAVEATT